MGINSERLYRIWKNMKYRCNDRNRPDYKYYGGKGIFVCHEWEKSYPMFKKWAIDNGYSDRLTLGRIDVNGMYCPDNCRWIPFSEQRENTTQARKVTINGRTQTLKSWCREFGISYNMVIMRVHRGMDDVAALLTPKQRG